MSEAAASSPWSELDKAQLEFLASIVFLVWQDHEQAVRHISKALEFDVALNVPGLWEDYINSLTKIGRKNDAQMAYKMYIEKWKPSIDVRLRCRRMLDSSTRG